MKMSIRVECQKCARFCHSTRCIGEVSWKDGLRCVVVFWRRKEEMGLIGQMMNSRVKTIRMELEGVLEWNSSGTS